MTSRDASDSPDAYAEPGTPGLLEPVFAMLRRRRGIATWVGLLTASAAALGAFLAAPQYTAQATLIVKPGREFVYQPEVGSAEAAKSFRLGEMVNSEVEILSSRDLAAQVVEAIGPVALFPDVVAKASDPKQAFARCILAFRQATNVQAVLESSVIKVSFEHEDPELAARAANLLVERFKDKHLEIFSEERSGFLGLRMEEVEKALDDAEQALQTFRQEKGVFDLSEQRRLLLSQRVQLDTVSKSTQHELSEVLRSLEELAPDGGHSSGVRGAGLSRETPADARLRLRREHLAEVEQLLGDTEIQLSELRQRSAAAGAEGGAAAVTLDQAVLDHALSSLLELQLREKELLRDYEEDSRAVQGLREEIRTVQDFLHSLDVRAGVEVRQAIALNEAKRDALTKEVARLTGEVADLEEEAMREAVEERAAELRSQRLTLEARAATVGEQLTELDEEIRTLDLAERRSKELERNVALAEERYRVYVGKVEEARISEDLDRQKQINVKLIESASPPVRADGLSRKLRLALGLIAGAATGIACALFVDLAAPKG